MSSAPVPTIPKPGPVLDNVGRPPQRTPVHSQAGGDAMGKGRVSVIDTVKAILRKKEKEVAELAAKSALKQEQPAKKADPKPISDQVEVEYLDEVPDGVNGHRGPIAQPGKFVRCAKMFIPEVENYNFIGRIIGPRGMSVRRIETETTCKFQIRGKRSVKDPLREAQLRGKPGWLHLEEPLHVLITCVDDDLDRCNERLDRGVSAVQGLLTPTYDEFKRQQLVQLALINGTYRPL
ncbi:unnamed protein product [Bursaphelenchus xylophilus]|uniref:(pine wood nematode) hypothetical protein n=1 Tax=Bursaphelenchus xylophilus TaxID=6326 RepID=A0A1I7RZN8_BURXY|nr:unnamed protein product [Bursaphelenchus xylophilus]CAG9111479.1 unnamed protein product [Bursaphelenchus xylophilus]